MATVEAPRLLIFRAYNRIGGSVRRLLAHPRAPHIALALVLALGIGARTFHLGIPAYNGHGQGYVFDESYYVSAAHVIGGKTAVPGDVYAHASPAGTDPNGEHPQLGKLVIAGGIAAFGDNSSAWRITAVIFGGLAILLLYWLVRSAGGSEWLAVGAAGLASFDNLWVVSSRIAVLDIYVIPFILAGVALYLRRRPILAGVALGIGGTVKEFAVYGLFVLILLELMRGLRALWEGRRDARPSAAEARNRPWWLPAGSALIAVADRRGLRSHLRRAMMPVTLVLVTGITYFSLLSGLDALVTPYSGHHRVDRGQSQICGHLWLWEGGCNHFAFINRYASSIRDTGGPRGIAATPVQFWLDRKAIPYYKVTRSVLVRGRVVATTSVILFQGKISRVLLFTSWIAILLNVWWAIRRRDDMSFLVLAWIVGTWLPSAFLHAFDQRTTYLYYMVVTMPGIYLAVARLLAIRRIPRWLVAAWVAGFLWDFADLYPFRTLSGS